MLKKFLNTLLKRPEYMQLTLTIIPQERVDKYTLMEKERNGKLYIRINKGMYGLPQTGRLANNLLITQLVPHGYRPCTHTHGLCWHDTKPITFTLVVDDFGIKYLGKLNADHLLNALKENYEVTEYWAGKLYCGMVYLWTGIMIIERWTCQCQGKLQTHSTNYSTNSQTGHNTHLIHLVHRNMAPQPNSLQQFSTPPLLTPQGIEQIQQVVSALLY
jgi:hypothetical protein